MVDRLYIQSISHVRTTPYSLLPFYSALRPASHSLSSPLLSDPFSSGRKTRFGPFFCLAMAPTYRAASASSHRRPESRPFGVLFVCLGNICRSPTAEAVFRHAVEKRRLESLFNIDSAGTIDYHEGGSADARMKAAALKRGVKLTSISRPIRPSDFEEFDLILAMDKQNKEDILKAYDRWSKKQALPLNSKEKVKLMCSYCKMHRDTEVPDPYYGGPEGFEKVLDLLEDACESLLDSIVSAGEELKY